MVILPQGRSLKNTIGVYVASKGLGFFLFKASPKPHFSCLKSSTQRLVLLLLPSYQEEF